VPTLVADSPENAEEREPMNVADVDRESGPYRKHIVAFADILGFKAMIDQVEAGTLHHGALNQCLSFSERLGRGTPKFTIMSDAIVISSELEARRTGLKSRPRWKPPTTEENLQRIFSMLNLLSTRFLRMGVFVRGAVTIGNLYHRGNVVYGDGLVKAYLLETNEAVFPRIIVSPELIPFAQTYQIRRHGDEHSFLHILSALEEMQDADENTRKYHRLAFTQMRNTIETRLKECAEEQRIYKKIRWFAEYWNRYCPDLPELSKIKI
jgi:hypothetical protein